MVGQTVRYSSKLSARGHAYSSLLDSDPSSSNDTTPADLRPSSVSGSSASDHMNTTTRSSTPLTELSSDLDLPAENFQPIPTEQARRRREQSDRASAEIGNRLLKGWALLMDECPNGSCHGIPLVRPPSSGPRKDPRKVRETLSQHKFQL